MKKLIGFYLLFLITVYLLASCDSNNNQSENNSEITEEQKMDESNMESSDMKEEISGDQTEMMDTTQMEQEYAK